MEERDLDIKHKVTPALIMSLIKITVGRKVLNVSCSSMGMGRGPKAAPGQWLLGPGPTDEDERGGTARRELGHRAVKRLKIHC